MRSIFQPIQINVLALIAGYSFGGMIGLGISATILLIISLVI